MRLAATVSCLCLSVLLTAAAVAQRAGITVILAEPQATDQYLAGRVVRVSAPVAGDVVAAGRRLIIDAAVNGDLLAAAETLDLRADVGDDARLAGRAVTVDARIRGHLLAAGEDVLLDPDTSIGDWAWLAGRNVTVGGRIGRELRAAGQQIIVSADVGGDANLIGERIRIEADAVIGGDLILQSETVEIADGATVQGEIIREDLPEQFGIDRRVGALRDFAAALFSAVTLIAAALATFLLFPAFTRSATARGRRGPFRVLGAGLATAVLTPFVVALLFLSGVGVIAGLALLGAYLLMLLAAMLFGIAGLGQLLVSATARTRQGGLLVQALAVVVAGALLLLLARIPLLGALCLVLVWIGGLGGAVAELWNRYHASPRARRAPQLG